MRQSRCCGAVAPGAVRSSARRKPRRRANPAECSALGGVHWQVGRQPDSCRRETKIAPSHALQRPVQRVVDGRGRHNAEPIQAELRRSRSTSAARASRPTTRTWKASTPRCPSNVSADILDLDDARTPATCALDRDIYCEDMRWSNRLWTPFARTQTRDGDGAECQNAHLRERAVSQEAN
jgi:hypothetical protein